MILAKLRGSARAEAAPHGERSGSRVGGRPAGTGSGGYNGAMLIRGSCHCGNISFELDWRPEPLEIPARACTCSFCSKHGGVWTSCPTGSLSVTIADPSAASAYSFETRTAQFHVCSRCGVVPLSTSRIEGRLFAVVNVNTFDGIPPSLLRKTSATLEGETEHARLSRRARNWIADVVFTDVRG